MAAAALPLGRTQARAERKHPRTIGWLGTTALAMGGSNQSLFLIGAIFATQGSASVPLLFAGLLLSWAAAPGWTELILMYPNRVGGIASCCAEAFRPYAPVLANLTGVAYWWGWVPTCGLTAILSASALHEWYLPGVPVPLMASLIVLAFLGLNLLGIKWVTRVAIPIAIASASLALLSSLIPVIAGTVDWHQASSFHLTQPFSGTWGAITSAMAGLYLIGFAAPAFEAAACHVGETKDYKRNVPRAMFASGAVASVYFVIAPVVWLGVLGPSGLEGELMRTLGPTFAPLLGSLAKSAAIWFMVLNMFHGTLQPLAGASRTMSQLSEDGLLPRILEKRNRFDVPWVATLLTAVMAIIFLQSGDPPWVIAAANFCYLIGIGLPSLAVWLLRRNEPEMERPYRAPRGTIVLGVIAACVWGISTLLGFEQFGLPTILFSLALAYSGAAAYAWRRWRDRDRQKTARRGYRLRSLHVKLTGAMLAVMALDGAGYLLAVSYVDKGNDRLIVLLLDIFVVVAILTITVGLVLPGMISHAVSEVAERADKLATGTLAELNRAMHALSRGDLDAAHASADIAPVRVRSRDEVGEMTRSFNVMQAEVASAALALDTAREGVQTTGAMLERHARQQAAVARIGKRALEGDSIDDLVGDIAASARDVLGVECAAVLVSGPWVSGGRFGPEPTPACEVERVPIRTASGPLGALEVWARDGERGPLARDERDFVAALANVIADAIERARSQERMRHQAVHDPLTGLPNRTLFVDRLELALAQCERRGSSVGVLFLDLDGFKHVNDGLGHATGDELLRSLSARLVQTLRPGDTVARFGGDEFVIICDDLHEPSEAAAIAERTIAAMARPFVLQGSEHFVSASVGIAVSDGVRRDAEDLIREADAAMYRAKERGRGGYDVYDEIMRARSVARLRTENELRRALQGGELAIAYQPIVSLKTRRAIGVEALLRWQHPERGEVLPAEFIALAEETGMIVPIGSWVLEEACRQGAAWHAARPDEPPLMVTVNLSARQVAHHGVVEAVESALARSGLDPATLSLEITESVLMDNSDATIGVLEALKALGVRLVLDDFGTGYSSLAYVERFPIDALKIDRAFVAALGDGHRDATIVEAIIAMADGLRVDVIAEGVESGEAAALLRDLGCRAAQGYHYARPMPAASVESLFDTTLPAERAVA